MSPPSNPHRPFRNGRTEDSIRQAFDRALQHAQLAMAEGVAGARALLDVASIGVLGEPAQSHRNLAELARTLDQIEAALSSEAPSFRNAALSTLLGAVDREVTRWEVRSQRDPEARAVLRAFLGMREVLWELGVRKPEPQERDSSRRRPRSDGRSTSHNPADRAQRRSSRVQRIKIQG